MKNFKDLIKEIKTNENKGLVNKQKGLSFNFDQPFDKKKLEEANLLNKINEIIKFRDPILETMSYESWAMILQNKLVEELDPKQAKMLYEQDMFRAEKVQTAAKARAGRSGRAGGGVRKRKVAAAVDPWTPSDLLLNAGDEYYQPSTIAGGSDGVKFSTWNAEVAAGEPAQTLSQSDTAHQPKYLTSAINGEPGVLMGLYPDVPEADLKISGPMDSDAFTFAMVTQFTAPTSGFTQGGRIARARWNKGRIDYTPYSTYSSTVRAYYSGAKGGPYFTPAIDHTVQHWIVSGADSATNLDWKESTTVLATPKSNNTPSNNAQITMSIRSYEFSDGSTGDLEWRVAEILYLSREISASEKTNLLAYWQGKYGV